ncbi:MAG: hypothetical protein LBR60_04835 [Fibrobacter sp.]|jgi:hypothetical protein|nr:hypothetical protein [Fibrobacter sp.]
MEAISVLALVLSLAAVILGVLILSKVNKLITMLRTPIVKKFSPDMNLKPSSRRPISAGEMASRGERNNSNRDNRPSQGQGKDRSKENNQNNRGNNRPSSEAPRDRDRMDRRNNGRSNMNGNRPRRPEAPAGETFAALQETPVAIETAETTAPAQMSEGRRPLAPRAPVEAMVPVPVETTPVVEADNIAASEFEPSKVRYGRRNVVKKNLEV